MLRKYSSNGTETIHLGPKVTTVGSRDCDIILQDDSVEPQHAVIEYDTESRTFWMKDLDTQSGVTINGHVLYGTTAELKRGDHVAFGYGQEYVFEPPTTRVHRVGLSPAPVGALPSLRETRTPSPGPKLLLPLESTHLVSQARPSSGYAAAYRQKVFARAGSLDRAQHRRRRVTSNAWTTDKVTYSVTSPSSSGSWDGVGKTGDENQPHPVVQYLQDRVAHLEAMVNGGSSDSGISVDIANRGRSSDRLLTRVNRLQTQLAQKYHNLPHADNFVDEVRELKTALERSEREKAELHVNLSKARDALRDREGTIVDLVTRKEDMHKDLESSFSSSSSLSLLGVSRMRRNSDDSDTLTLGRLDRKLPIWRDELDSAKETRRYRDAKRLDEADWELLVGQKVIELLCEDVQKLQMQLTPSENASKPGEALNGVVSKTPADKYNDLEIRLREKLIKKVTDESQMVAVDQVITKVLKNNWMELIQMGFTLMQLIRDALGDYDKEQTVKLQLKQWAGSLEEGFRANGLSGQSMMHIVDLLIDRMQSIGAGDHWLLSILVPILREAAHMLDSRGKNRQEVAIGTEVTLDHLESTEKTHEDMRRELSNRDDALASADSRLSNAEAEKKELEARMAALMKELASRETEHSNLTATHKALQAEHDEASVEKAALVAEIANWRHKFEQVQEERDEIEQMQEENESLRVALEKTREELKQLQAQKSTQEQAQEQQQSPKDEDLEKLKAKLAELEAGNKDREAAWSEVSARDAQMSRLRHERQQREQEIFELHEKLVEMEKRREEAESMVARMQNEGHSYREASSDGDTERRIEELEAMLREKEETNQMINNRLKETMEELDSCRTARSSEPDYHTMKSVLDETDKSFWDLSHRLAGMLDLDLKRNEAATDAGSGRLLGASRFDTVVSARHDDRIQAAQELARGVEDLLERIRKQNQELETHRGAIPSASSLLSPSSTPSNKTAKKSDPPSARKSPSSVTRRPSSVDPPTSNEMRSSFRSKARQERRGKQDFPVKVVTFNLPQH